MRIKATWLSLAFTYFTTFDGQNFGVISRANDVVVFGDSLVRLDAKDVVAVGRRIGKVLPRVIGLAIVVGFLQSPDAGTRRVGHLDVDVGDVEFLETLEKSR